MTYRYINVKHFKRGASYNTGKPRMCIRCRSLERHRRKRAVITAIRVDGETKRRFPVEYCQDHIPVELR